MALSKYVIAAMAFALGCQPAQLAAQNEGFPYVSDLTNPGRPLVVEKDQIISFEELPSAFTHAVTLMGRDGIAYVSRNGRFVMRGVIFDSWTGQTIQTMQELRGAKKTVDLSELGLRDEDVDPMYYGSGLKKVTLFVDPLCPFCAQLFDQLVADPRYERDYTFVIYTVPFLGEESTKAVTVLSCAPNREEAKRALLTHDRRWMKTQPAPDHCDPQPILQRTILSQMLGVTGVPYLIGAEGGIARGLPADLRGFLATN